MKKENAYSEIVQSQGDSKRKGNGTLQESMIDMIIHEAMLKAEKLKLEEQINEALDHRNEKKFMKLSSELNDLMEMFG